MKVSGGKLQMSWVPQGQSSKGTCQEKRRGRATERGKKDRKAKDKRRS